MEIASKGKILFLHGFTQNAKIFEKRVKTLLNALKVNFPGYEFVIPDAPHVLEDNSNEEEVKRGWLYLNPTDKLCCNDFVKEEVEYLGLDKSLKSILGLGTADVKCIIAFSQGSLITLFLSALITNNDEYMKYFPNLKCVIITSSFIEPRPLNTEVKDIIFKNEYPIPSLHIIGEGDTFILPEKSKKAATLYKDAEVYFHPGKHFLPTKKEDLEYFISFLKKYLD
jgi:hypothetical protein